MKFFRKNKPVKIILIIVILSAAAAFFFAAKLQFSFLRQYFFSDMKSSTGIAYSEFAEKRNAELIKEYLLLNDKGKRDFYSKLFCKRRFIVNHETYAVFDDRSEFFCASVNSSPIGGSVYIWAYVDDSIMIKRSANEGFSPFSECEVWRLNTNGFNYIFIKDNVLIFERSDGEEESVMTLEY